MQVQENKQLIYLYDLPKVATSVKLADIIKKKCGYDLPEPVQFRDGKPHPVTGVISPFQLGIIKVDTAEWKRVSDALKYFDFDDGTEVEGQKKQWECRALPFDRDLLGANKLSTNTMQNIFVRGLPKDMTTQQLDAEFTARVGPVKSAKISRTVDESQQIVSSNGYGFVCFQTKEEREQAEKLGEINGASILRYVPRDPREVRQIYNNVYVKNFDPAWTKDDLIKQFSTYGPIKSCVVMKKAGKDGVEKPFAFICFDKADDKSVGPASANNAVTSLHDQTIGEFKLYVQPAIPAQQRQAQVAREQQRFKNSKKKCNLFVKGFPNTFTTEDLQKLFEQFGEIESIKLIPA
jgi:RNA recognition motif-containing protein